MVRSNCASTLPRGTARLRDHVLVTNGGSEANFTALWGLLEKGDHAAVMLPNYLQTWGLARAYAAKTNALLPGGRQREREGALGAGR